MRTGVTTSAVTPVALTSAATTIVWIVAARSVATDPPPVQVPFALEPSSVNAAGVVTVTEKMPSAAVFPVTPVTSTKSPVCRPCGCTVVSAIGELLETAVSVNCVVPVEVDVNFAMASRIVCRTAVDCVAVNVRALCVTDWLRSR
jgi:hypothetical protein